jgi:hypothetical protein
LREQPIDVIAEHVEEPQAQPALQLGLVHLHQAVDQGAGGAGGVGGRERRQPAAQVLGRELAVFVGTAGGRDKIQDHRGCEVPANPINAKNMPEKLWQIPAPFRAASG